MNKLKSLAANLAVSVFALLVLFLLIEGGFKITALLMANQAGPTPIAGLPYDNTPNAKFWRYDREAGLNYYAHNSFGMRSPEISREKPAGTLRIALLGDSVAHGGNVTQNKTTAAQLEALLKKRLPGKRVEVLNFGVAGFSLKEYSILNREKVLAFSPDMVVVGLCLNDYIIPGKKEMEGMRKTTKLSWWKERADNLFRSHFIEWLKKVSFSVFFSSEHRSEGDLEAKYDRILEQTAELSDDEKKLIRKYVQDNHIPLKYYVGDMAAEFEFMRAAEWGKNREFIRRLVEDSRQAGARTLFFAYPLSVQVLEGYHSTEPQQTIQLLADVAGADYVEMLGVFQAYARTHPEQPLFPKHDIMHMYGNGHAVVAEVLAKHLGEDK